MLGTTNIQEFFVFKTDLVLLMMLIRSYL